MGTQCRRWKFINLIYSCSSGDFEPAARSPSLDRAPSILLLGAEHHGLQDASQTSLCLARCQGRFGFKDQPKNVSCLVRWKVFRMPQKNSLQMSWKHGPKKGNREISHCLVFTLGQNGWVGLVVPSPPFSGSSTPQPSPIVISNCFNYILFSGNWVPKTTRNPSSRDLNLF